MTGKQQVVPPVQGIFERGGGTEIEFSGRKASVQIGWNTIDHLPGETAPG